ncbi:MAG: hypothetical protein J0I41_08335 [Filimonas sp.]|nr:hypothetical protein [Filimonas sp.]
MNTDVAQFLPEDFAPESRVWIYQNSRLFTMGEALDMEPMLEEFAASWKSHGAQVKAFANLLFGQFIVLMADETMAGVSGCSTDSSVRFVKQIEEKYRVNLFDRQTLAFIIKDKVQVLPLSQLNYAVENNFITPDTLYFNNLAATKAELISNWIIPVKQSWLGKRLKMQEA